MQPWHSQAYYNLKKYSCLTCRGEQIPYKFDTYSRQLQSTFGCAADLNTLTAHQLKSTFGTKRLMHKNPWDADSFSASQIPCVFDSLHNLSCDMAVACSKTRSPDCIIQCFVFQFTVLLFALKSPSSCLHLLCLCIPSIFPWCTNLGVTFYARCDQSR